MYTSYVRHSYSHNILHLQLINQIEELHGIIEALESSSNGSSNSGDVGRGVLISRLKDTLLEIESLKRNVVYLHANNLEQARTIDSLSGQLDEYHERVESMDVEKAVISDVATVQLNESRRICGALEQEVHALESQREQHQVEMNELQRQFNETQRQLLRQNNAQRQLHSIQDERNEAQRQLKSSLDENHKVQRQLQSIKDEKAAVEQQLKSCQNNNI